MRHILLSDRVRTFPGFAQRYYGGDQPVPLVRRYIRVNGLRVIRPNKFFSLEKTLPLLLRKQYRKKHTCIMFQCTTPASRSFIIRNKTNRIDQQ
ncbi:hypothetical protein Y032_0014g2388 [Ancylostoma ceylanicum]|uniref:Uncharacterized protein n=1 Tax=Ancylostoma ceylanicum TaxID=53326 RepID=A0A016VB21_9BILA|nr:hypothetical protein Y032_0014g2388 [Ancylostoma ceylanicum]